MTLYKRRERFEHLSIKIGIAFSKAGLSPNQWTAVSIIPVLIAFYFLTQANFLAAALFFIISSFLDLVDGSVARVTGRVSRLGAYLDTVVDRYIEFIIILGLLFVFLPKPDFPVIKDIPMAAWIFLYLFGGMMTTYVKAAAREKGILESGELKGGLLERAERLVILFIGILFAAVTPVILSYIIILLAILTNISALQRMNIAIGLQKKAVETKKG